MGIPVILRLSNLVACRRSINPRFAPCSALILLVPCHQIIREIRFQLSSGSITKDSYELLADSGRDLKRSEEHTTELQSLAYLVCRLLLEKKKKNNKHIYKRTNTL